MEPSGGHGNLRSRFIVVHWASVWWQKLGGGTRDSAGSLSLATGTLPEFLISCIVPVLGFEKVEVPSSAWPVYPGSGCRLQRFCAKLVVLLLGTELRVLATSSMLPCLGQHPCTAWEMPLLPCQKIILCSSGQHHLKIFIYHHMVGGMLRLAEHRGLLLLNFPL